MVHLTVCYSHVACAFQSEFSLYSYLNVKEHLAQYSCDIWSLTNDWAVLWVLICTIHLTVCYCYFRYTFQGESILYSYLNATKLPARNKFDIWNWSDSTRIWTHNLLVRKQTLNHLAKRAKWLSCVVRTYLYGAFDCMLFSCHALVSEWIYTL